MKLENICDAAILVVIDFLPKKPLDSEELNPANLKQHNNKSPKEHGRNQKPTYSLKVRDRLILSTQKA